MSRLLNLKTIYYLFTHMYTLAIIQTKYPTITKPMTNDIQCFPIHLASPASSQEPTTYAQHTQTHNIALTESNQPKPFAAYDTPRACGYSSINKNAPTVRELYNRYINLEKNPHRHTPTGQFKNCFPRLHNIALVV